MSIFDFPLWLLPWLLVVPALVYLYLSETLGKRSTEDRDGRHVRNIVRAKTLERENVPRARQDEGIASDEGEIHDSVSTASVYVATQPILRAEDAELIRGESPELVKRAEKVAEPSGALDDGPIASFQSKSMTGQEANPESAPKVAEDSQLREVELAKQNDDDDDLAQLALRLRNFDLLAKDVAPLVGGSPDQNREVKGDNAKDKGNSARSSIVEDGLPPTCRRRQVDDDNSTEVEPLPWAQAFSGRICARGAPGQKSGRVAKWQSAGATAVVTLLRSDEPAFGNVGEDCEEIGLRWLHLPLSGKRAVSDDPSDRAECDLASLGRTVEVAQLLAEGESVVVHCSAGMHRTGVVCYLALRHGGSDRARALETIRQTREVTHGELVKTTRKHPVPLVDKAESIFEAFRTSADGSPGSPTTEISPPENLDIPTRGGSGYVDVREVRQRRRALLNERKSGEAMREVSDAEHRAATLVQRWFRTRKLVATVNYLVKCSMKRKLIAFELIETENSYVICLGLVVRQFARPMLERKLLDEEQFQRIFSNIEAIYDFHNNEFSVALEERVQRWSRRQMLGDVFLRFTPFLKMYGEYINNFDEGSALLKILFEKNKKLRKFVESVRIENPPPDMSLGSGLSMLQNLLLWPVQRIPRLEMLLKELIKVTPQDLHDDAENLRTALAQIQALAGQLNESKRQHEARKEYHDFAPAVSHHVHVGRMFSGKHCSLCHKTIISAHRRGAVKCSRCNLFAHHSCAKSQAMLKVCRGERPATMSPQAKRRLSEKLFPPDLSYTNVVGLSGDDSPYRGAVSDGDDNGDDNNVVNLNVDTPNERFGQTKQSGKKSKKKSFQRVLSAFGKDQ